MAKTKPTGDAIALLKADHRKVEELFEKFESAKGSVFVLCNRAKHDSRYPRYPGQPVVQCQGFEG